MDSKPATRRPKNNRSSLLDGLNPPQREAVLTQSGPLLVLAGAGTGKTRVVTVRIAELVRNGTPADRILGVTFTNKAALEMQERISPLLGKRLKQRPLIATFHSLCMRVLRGHAQRLGYPKRFAICDRGDQEGYAREVLRETKTPSALLRPSDLLFRISTWKSMSVDPRKAAMIAETDKDHLAASAFRRYEQTLRSVGAMDFDDLLLRTEELFQRFPDVLEEEAGRFDHLLVDEYQDTNGSQYRIVKHLAGKHRNLCVVGDDDQSIYAWRGADVHHILRFKDDWPDAKVVRLEDNYRCTGEIIQLANQLIVFNRVRHDKILRAARPQGERPRILQFPNEVKEASEVVADIRRRLEQPGVSPQDIAILFRTNEQPRPFETEMRKARIPYVLVGGQSFFEKKEVKDLLSYLKWIARPHDDASLLRIINFPARGLSQTTVQAWLKKATAAESPLWKWVNHSDSPQPMTAAAARGLEELNSLLRQCRQLQQQGRLAELTDHLVTQTDYLSEVRRKFPDPNEQEARVRSVEEVINAVAEYERDSISPDLDTFLDQVAIGERDFGDDKQKQMQRNAVVLMTLHSAKGLEFTEVYLVGMEEGILPHHRSVAVDGDAIDEERRLCYVGITRAQERLTLSLPLTRMKWGKPRDTEASRFLFEMTGKAEKG